MKLSFLQGVFLDINLFDYKRVVVPLLYYKFAVRGYCLRNHGLEMGYKVNIRKTRKKGRRSGLSVINFEHISHLF